ncbi:MAG TPA: VWA domain-containing protein [Methylophilaceae bacterium]|jgi:mxaL protein
MFEYLRTHRDSALMLGALLLLIAAMLRPTVPLKHNIYSYMLVADITQSMNTEDMKINGKQASRMLYMEKMMHEIVASLPCGTKVSLAPFAGVSVAPLYNPIEVCDNYAVIQETIDHLDWRMAWSGNSRIRDSVLSIARSIRAFPEPAQVVYFTDGEEAPRLHVFNTRDLTGFQGADSWLFVGIGSLDGAAIPKYSEKNQRIGYWANESFALQPGVAQISEQNIGTRNDSVADGADDRFIAKLDEEYLKSLTKEIGADYVRGDSLQSVLHAMTLQKPARRDIAPFGIHWILALLGGLILLLAYIPKHPLAVLKHRLMLLKS